MTLGTGLIRLLFCRLLFEINSNLRNVGDRSRVYYTVKNDVLY